MGGEVAGGGGVGVFLEVAQGWGRGGWVVVWVDGGEAEEGVGVEAAEEGGGDFGAGGFAGGRVGDVDGAAD